jgi:hypothetical protein
LFAAASSIKIYAWVRSKVEQTHDN